MKRYQRSVDKWIAFESVLWDVLSGVNLEEHLKTLGKAML